MYWSCYEAKDVQPLITYSTQYIRIVYKNTTLISVTNFVHLNPSLINLYANEYL